MKTPLIYSLVVLTTLLTALPAKADLATKAAAEVAEYVIRKFGKEVAEEGLEKLVGRLTNSAAKHGDDLLSAVRKIGPKAIGLADEAGENAPLVIAFLSRHGDDAARILTRPGGMALFKRFGDDAAEVLIKHKGIAQPLIEGLGAPAVKALGAVGPQSGRRLAMLAESGELTKLGRTAEVLAVIGRYGDSAADFIWRNKGALAIGTALTTFLVNPEPFINGSKQLASTVAEHAVQPALTAVGHVAQETAKGASSFLSNFLSVALVVVGCLTGGCLTFAAKHPNAAGGAVKLVCGCIRRP